MGDGTGVGTEVGTEVVGLEVAAVMVQLVIWTVPKTWAKPAVTVTLSGSSATIL